MFHQKQQGFTIVELLVVIVVIAILAAITIVSYNGITNQAQTAKQLVAFDAWEKSIRAYQELNGTYPVPDGTDNYGACLGSDFSANGDFQAGQCILINGSNLQNYFENANLNAKLKQLINVPSAEFPYKRFSVSGMVIQQRGILYYASNNASVNSGTVWLGYYIASDEQCGRGVKSYDAASGFGQCRVTLRNSL